jgi:putative DNA primase/helicase
MLEIMREATRHGFAVIPLPRGSKKPTLPEWEKLRLTEDQLPGAFAGDCNGAILNGEPSGNRVDIDLDSSEAIALADVFLPPTPCTFGHAAKPRSHRIYAVPPGETAPKTDKWSDPVKHKNDRDADAEIESHMLVELRSTGSQTVWPGSLHKSGEVVAFDDGCYHEPAVVPGQALSEAANRLAAASLLARYWPGSGYRHDTALALAGLLARRGWSEDEIAQFVEAVAQVGGDEEAEDRAQAARDTVRNHLAGRPTTGRPRLREYIDPKVVDTVYRRLKLSDRTDAVGPDGYPLDDLGNSQRFVALFGDRIRCMGKPEQERWYVWDDRRWKEDTTGTIQELAKQTVYELRKQLGEYTNHENWGKASKWAAKSADGPRIREMVRLAKSDPAIRLELESFDRNPRLLNLLNGTLELDVERGEVLLREHRQEDLISKLAPVSYVPGARNALFDWNLDQFIPDREVREYIQEGFGYTLHGLPKRHAFLLQGTSHSGKSQLLKLMRNMLGEYAGALRHTSIVRDQHPNPGGHRADLIQVLGTRLVVISEVPENGAMDPALFKQISSGGDPTQLRGMYEEARSVTFTFALWIAANPLFAPPASDDAAYTRIVRIPFMQSLPEAERDEVRADQTCSPAITGEAALAWAVEGFKRLYGAKRGHLTMPESLREATEEMREATDRFKEGVDELFEFTGNLEDCIRQSHVWGAMKEAHRLAHGYTLQNNDREAFESTLERRGARRYKSQAIDGNNPVWRGMRRRPLTVLYAAPESGRNGKEAV